MNNKESEFVPLAEKLSNPLPQKNAIIKGNKIRNIQTTLLNIKDERKTIENITIEESDNDSDNVREIESKIEPILEGNRIVGITYTCCCGEESEIKFEIESEKTDNNIEIDDVDSNTVENITIDE